MSFREKLLDLKRRLSDRKMYSIVIAIIAAASIWGITQYKHSANLRQELDNQYNRAFYDMVAYVNNVESLLVKSLITSTPEKTASTLQEAWRQANLAQTNLGQLPISQQVLASTSKYLTQVGDLAYSLNYQNMSGKPLDQKQYGTIEQLHNYAVSLRKSLNDLQNELSSGRLKWEKLANKGTPLFKKASASMPVKEFESIDKTFQDYPTLIYDGPFSDHLVKTQPKGLTGNMMTVEQVKQNVLKFFGDDKVKTVENTGKNDNDPVKTYSYKVTFKGAPGNQSAVIDMTQKGGQAFWMIYNRPSASKKLTIDQAKAFGKKFLESRGYKDMKDTYYLNEDNTATINYAYQQGNVVVYPDLIKLKIALDNGEVIGFESKGYLFSHATRNIPAPRITQEQARAKISGRVKISGVGLAIIPTDFKTEIFTYEIKGKLGNQDFLVYINAETGKEENVLMIINTPNGVLTI